MKRGKKYEEKAKLVDPEKLYSPEEAIKLAKQMSYVKFDETVELHLRTGLDPRHADQQIRGTALLPHGLGKTARMQQAQTRPNQLSNEFGHGGVVVDVPDREAGAVAGVVEEVACPTPLGRVRRFDLHQREVHDVGVEAVGRLEVAGRDRHVMECQDLSSRRSPGIGGTRGRAPAAITMLREVIVRFSPPLRTTSTLHGVVMVAGSGAIGSGPRFRIRGSSSLSSRPRRSVSDSVSSPRAR